MVDNSFLVEDAAERLVTVAPCFCTHSVAEEHANPWALGEIVFLASTVQLMSRILVYEVQNQPHQECTVCLFCPKQ